MQRVILASGSPRRKELLSLIGIHAEVIKSNAPEVITKSEPGQIVEELSSQKAWAVAKQFKDCREEVFVIGADTIVTLDGEILGKPEDAADAARMLRQISGRGHSAYTGVTILKNAVEDGKTKWQEVNFHRETIVYVDPLTQEEIDRYIATQDPMDKAGSYGIQGPFAAYVDRIDGDYQNVVGLPVSALYRQMKAMGWKGQD